MKKRAEESFKVLDVGCGSNPKGDVNIDLLIKDDAGYHVKVYREKIPNFVLADAHSLPFRDKSFRKVYSSHLLEHVNDEALVELEMMRVASQFIDIILLCRLFDFLHYLRYPRMFFWDRIHYKRSYWLNPLKARNVKLNFANAKEVILHKKRSLDGKVKIPIPFETETILDVREK